MKYNRQLFRNLSDREKNKIVEEELRLETHNGTTKDDLLMLLEWAYKKDLERNDGWIPVEKEWPPFGQRLQATIIHHEWVSDYYSAWVPPEEKIHHPAYTEVCEIYPVGELWCYNCSEDDYNGDVAYIEPAKCLSSPVAEIIAWQPLPEPYRPERREEE